ncbi:MULTISPECIES: MFS transporter [unclassified Nocardia]|uniref:MFS transporter n=1 Tax=unclassified Nocardia TaxID=2637762 RepID=UPI001CE469B6|nr:MULTISPECIES: MFS transporter [unclassified Nocardia]
MSALLQAEPLAPLRHRNFRRLATGRLMTYSANMMAPVALAFAVLDLTGSTTDLGYVVGTRSITNVALLLLGGVVADRVSRAMVLQGSALVAACVQAAIAASVLLHFASIPLLVGLSALNGAVAAMSFPASAASTPQTVPQELLRQANAVMRITVNIGTIIGASLGGVLVASLGPGWGLGCNAVLFACAAMFFAGIRIPAATAQSVEHAHPLTELADGWREFWSRSWVWSVVLLCTVVNAVQAGGVQVLGPVIANQTMGRTAWGVALTAQMVGAVAGGLIAARSRIHRMLYLGVALILMAALPLIVLALAPTVALLAFTMFLSGVALEQVTVAWDLSLQENIPPDRLARVYSYDAVGSFLALPIGEIGAGILAQHIGNSATLLGGSAALVAATIATLGNRQVRNLTALHGREDQGLSP